MRKPKPDKIQTTRKDREAKDRERSKRFIETARKLDVDETEEGQEKAFGKVGIGKPSKAQKTTKGELKAES